MNKYHMVIMHRQTRAIMVILQVNSFDLPITILDNYAKWGDFQLKDLLYTTVPVLDYAQIVQDLHNGEAHDA